MPLDGNIISVFGISFWYYNIYNITLNKTGFLTIRPNQWVGMHVQVIKLLKSIKQYIF